MVVDVHHRPDDAAAWDAAIADLLARAKMVQPDELAYEVNLATPAVAAEITIYLIDHEQMQLWPLPERGKPTPPPVVVEGTAAGRAFTRIRTQRPEPADVAGRWWIPMIDGSERVGVAEVFPHHPPADPDLFQTCVERLIGLVGHLVTVKLPYGDSIQQVRRTRPMTPASELLLGLLPPLTFSCPRLVVSAVLEPTYDVGGDAFDYAVDGSTARFMVLDGMGRGLRAGLTTTAAIAAIRAARRAGDDLTALAAAADAVLAEQFPDLRYVTGVLAELDLESGRLRYLNAGHPRPLLIRDGRVVGPLPGGRRMPLGLAETVEAGTADLEPGDRLLLWTDGIGDRPDDLIDLVERCVTERRPAPETLRRLAHQVLAGPDRPDDDATLMLVEWSDAAAERTQP